jgi:hypothetical protein
MYLQIDEELSCLLDAGRLKPIAMAGGVLEMAGGGNSLPVTSGISVG